VAERVFKVKGQRVGGLKARDWKTRHQTAGLKHTGKGMQAKWHTVQCSI